MVVSHSTRVLWLSHREVVWVTIDVVGHLEMNLMKKVSLYTWAIITEDAMIQGSTIVHSNDIVEEKVRRLKSGVCP